MMGLAPYGLHIKRHTHSFIHSFSLSLSFIRILSLSFCINVYFPLVPIFQDIEKELVRHTPN